MSTYGIRIWARVGGSGLTIMLQLSEKYFPNTQGTQEITGFLVDQKRIEDKEMFQMLHPNFNIDKIEIMCKKALSHLAKSEAKDYVIVCEDLYVCTEKDY